MFLNFSLAQRLQVPLSDRDDPKLVALLQRAYERLRDGNGLATQTRSRAEQMFREALAAQK